MSILPVIFIIYIQILSFVVTFTPNVIYFSLLAAIDDLAADPVKYAKRPGSAEVRQTDEHGKITAWDTYESSGDTVRFGMDETKTIREAIEGRLSALSSEIRKGLLATAAAYGMPEQRPSVRKRLAEIRERRMNLETGGEKGRKKRKGTQWRCK